MKNVFLIFVFTLTTIFNEALSCSCGPKHSVKKEIESSEAVIVGQVISKDLTQQTEARYKILVTVKYKGQLTSDTITIVTGIGGGDCGYIFETGKLYIIYALKSGSVNSENTFSTNSCMRTMRYDEKEIESIKKIIG